MILEIKKEIDKYKDETYGKNYRRFFKTEKGEYGEKDKFIGVRVPILRKIANKYKNLSLREIQSLLSSEIHEYRFIALLFLINRYKKQQENIFNFYVKNYKNINSWDLVDISAPHIFGDYLLRRDKKILYNFAKSNNLWKRRIAVVSCLKLIKNNDLKDILKIVEFLLNDKHDLIHKACGWMLREVGKRDIKILKNFLNKNHQKMPRICLHYALEKMDKEEKKKYLIK